MSAEAMYIGTNGHVAAVDMTTGHELWRTALGGRFSATRINDVCLLQHEGRIFAGSCGHLFCLDATTGSILWHNELEGLGYNDVTLAIADKAIQFTSRSGRRR